MTAILSTLLLLASPHAAPASCVDDLWTRLRGGAHLFESGELPRSVQAHHDAPMSDTDHELAALAVQEWTSEPKEVIYWEARDQAGRILFKAFDVGWPLDVNEMAFFVPTWPKFNAMLSELGASAQLNDVAEVRCVHVHVVRVGRYARWPFASFSQVDRQISVQFRALLHVVGLDHATFKFGLLEPLAGKLSTAGEFTKTEYELPATMDWRDRAYPLSRGKRRALERTRGGTAPLTEVFNVD